MSACRRPCLRSEAGTTLIEVIVTIAIMSIAFVAILGGFFTSIFMSDMHRKQASAQTILRSYADAVSASYQGPSGVWPLCGTAASYTPAAIGFTVSGPYQASVSSVQYWNTSTNLFQASCPVVSGSPTDSGLQQINLQVLSSSAARGVTQQVTETVTVIKRCTGVRSGTGGGQCP